MNDVFQGLPREALHVLPHCGEGPTGSELFQLLLPIPRMKPQSRLLSFLFGYAIKTQPFCTRIMNGPFNTE